MAWFRSFYLPTRTEIRVGDSVDEAASAVGDKTLSGGFKSRRTSEGPLPYRFAPLSAEMARRIQPTDWYKTIRRTKIFTVLQHRDSQSMPTGATSGPERWVIARPRAEPIPLIRPANNFSKSNKLQLNRLLRLLIGILSHLKVFVWHIRRIDKKYNKII